MLASLPRAASGAPAGSLRPTGWQGRLRTPLPAGGSAWLALARLGSAWLRLAWLWLLGVASACFVLVWLMILLDFGLIWFGLGWIWLDFDFDLILISF